MRKYGENGNNFLHFLCETRNNIIFEVGMKSFIYITGCIFLLTACKDKPASSPEEGEVLPSTVTYARGFSLKKEGNYTLVEVISPWPGATEKFRYLLLEKGQEPPQDKKFDAVISVPVESIVVTSTTHIPALEALGVEDRLTGFPNTKYISSERTRKHIASGKIKELGNNEALNTEMLIDLKPAVLIGFSINNDNKVYETIQRAGIPVVYNGDWTEETPLGKAEWIKFFGALFKAEAKADSVFNRIAEEYLYAKKIAKKAREQPAVLSGALYKDVWYLPAGGSWAAQFLKDAHANYLWKDTQGTGSLSLSVETVMEKAREADFWIAPAQFTTYEALENASAHYTRFEAFKNRRIFTFSLTKGATGGILYYELAPNRPDMVLKDLIHILHPQLLPDHEPFFFKPLQ